MKYRKKPVVIEAKQLTTDTANEVYDWIIANGGRITGAGGGDAGTHLIIETLEGDHRADEGDWIIKGIQNEFYPCKPDIFEATYEPQDRKKTRMKTFSHKIEEMIPYDDSGKEVACPLPLEVIPNKMGINLVSVDSVVWQKQTDGQLTSLTIYFNPADKGDENESDTR